MAIGDCLLSLLIGGVPGLCAELIRDWSRMLGCAPDYAAAPGTNAGATDPPSESQRSMDRIHARTASLSSSGDSVEVARLAPSTLVYSVTFGEGPIGLQLETDAEHTHVIVRGFAPASDGKPLPAEECGFIQKGDIMTAINDQLIKKCTFQEVVRLMRVAGRPVTLRFMRPECVL